MGLPGIDRLSARQRDVLDLVAKGLTNEEIGGVLGIAFGTVRTHGSSILGALDVTNRTEAVACLLSARADPVAIGSLLARPAIAILPIAAIDDDPRARTVAAGFTYDLASLCARSTWLPVIALVSTAGARALATTSQGIGAALGARFLLDGALSMHAPGGWRLTVLVDDASTGTSLWTERYDFAGADLNAVQDAICQGVVAAAYPVIMRHLLAGLRHAPRAGEFGVWELAHMALSLRAEREPQAIAQAQAQLVLALAREPALVLAHYGLGLCAYDEVLNQWGLYESAGDRLADEAERCIELAPHAAEGYFLQARWFQTRSDNARAAQVLEIAIAHNPSFAEAHALLAQALFLTGRGDEAQVRMEHAMRLGPRAYVAGMATLSFMRGDYAAALAGAEQAVSLRPRYTFARALAAAAAWWLGDASRTAEHLLRLRSDYPAFAPAGFLRTFGAEVDAVSRFTHALDALGLPPGRPS